MSARTVVALMLVLSAAPCVDADATGPGQGPDDPATKAFVDLANGARRDAGCRALEWDDRIANVALAHSRDMIERSFFDHTNPSGQSPFDRLKAADIAYRMAGENILYGTIDPKRALDLWMNSEHHRENLLTCGFTRHGVGRVEGHWTHVFVTPPK